MQLLIDANTLTCNLNLWQHFVVFNSKQFQSKYNIFFFDWSDLEWLTFTDSSHDLLAALHPPYSLILWNADSGTKIWKKSYTEVLQSFAFDPFVSSNLTCEY